MLKKIGFALSSLGLAMVPKHLVHSNEEEKKEDVGDDSVNYILRNRPPATAQKIGEQLSTMKVESKK